MNHSRNSKLAICAELSGAAAAAIQYAWQGLSSRFGPKTISKAGTPRITFLAGSFDTARAAAFMDSIELASRQVGPFSVQLTGVVTVQNALPVLAVGATMTNDLRMAFRRFFEACPEAGMRVLPEFTAETWVPHIALTAAGLDAGTLVAMEAYLRSHSFAWRCAIQTVDLVRVEETGDSRIETWPLMGETEAVETMGAVAGRA
jgi:hypothetical protein